MALVLASIKLTHSAPWLDPMLNYLVGLEPGGVVSRRVLNRMLILGVLRSVRKVYLGRLQQTLMTTVVAPNRGAKRTRSAEAMSRVESLRKAYESLDEAVLSGNQDRVGKASQRINQIDRAIAVQGDLNDSRQKQDKRARVMSLSAQTSAIMRSRALQILDYLTNPQYATGPIPGPTGVVHAAGRLDLLDAIKTPSATDALMGRPSESMYNILWRHLEFGTGVYASSSSAMGQNTMQGSGQFKNSDGSWWYGPAGGRAPGEPGLGLLVKGSKPMAALWGPSGLAHDEHYVAAHREMVAAMEELAPRFT